LKADLVHCTSEAVQKSVKNKCRAESEEIVAVNCCSAREYFLC